MNKKSIRKRNRDPDFSKIAVVLNLLRQYPDGLWLNEIKKKLEWSSSGSISRWADGPMKDLIESIGFKNDADQYMGPRVIRLKPAFLNKEFTSESVRKLLETQKFLKSIGK